MTDRKQMRADVEAIVDPSKLAVYCPTACWFNPAGADKGTAAVQLGKLLGITAMKLLQLAITA